MTWPLSSAKPLTLARNALNTRVKVLAATPGGGRRGASDAAHFYGNKQLELYAARKAKPMTLRQLVFFGRSMNEERVIISGNYVRTELPVRIAHRLRDLQALPYVVVTQEGMDKVYQMYWSAFDKFRRFPEIKTLQDNEEFCKFVQGLLNEHSTVIPNLSLGLSLASPYLAPDRLDSFMRRMLVSRISRRVLAEHHIALSRDLQSKRQGNEVDTDHVGIIYTALSIKKCIEKCAAYLRNRAFDVDDDMPEGANITAAWPEIFIDGHTKTTFPYIPEHLETLYERPARDMGTRIRFLQYELQFLLGRTWWLSASLIRVEVS